MSFTNFVSFSLVAAKTVCFLSSALVLSALLPAAARGQTANLDADVSVDLKNIPAETQAPVREMLRRATKEVTAYYPAGSPSPTSTKLKCRFMFLPSLKKNEMKSVVLRNMDVNIYLPSSDFSWMENPAMTCGIMDAIIKCRTGFLPENTKVSAPAWLLAGLHRKLEEKADEAEAVQMSREYPALKILCMAGKTPSLAHVIENAAPPGEKGSMEFQLHSEICRLLLDMLRHTHKKQNAPFSALIESQETVGGAFEQFKTAFGPAIFPKAPPAAKPGGGQQAAPAAAMAREPSEKFEEWFQSEFKRRVLHLMSPGNSKYARACVKKILSPRGGDSSLENLQRDAKGQDELRMSILEAQKNIAMASSELPEGFQEPLRKMSSTLEDLKNGREKNFSEKIAAAAKEFEAAASRLEKIEGLLDKAERESVAAGKKFGGIFKVLDEMENENRNLWPSLRSYMDEVEKNN